MAKPKKAASPAKAEEATVGIGSEVKFLGYDASVPEEERVFEAGEVYEVVDAYEEAGDQVYVLATDNPDFDEDSDEDEEENPRVLKAEVFPEEIELVASVEETKEVVKGKKAAAPKGKAKNTSLFAESDAANDEEEEAPAPKSKAKAKAKTTAAPAKAKGKKAQVVEEDLEEQEEQAPAPKAKGKAKSKAVAAPASTKKAVGKKAAPLPEENEGSSDVAILDLSSEDEAVLSMVEENEDLTELVRSLEGDIGRSEFYIGGVLYHIKKSGKYKEVNGGVYAGNEGWRAYVEENYNMGYRKAQHLLEIYVVFSGSGIEDPADVVARLGWTKAQKLCKALELQPERADEFVELAESNTVLELSEVIKDEVAVGQRPADTRPKVARITLKFRYLEEDARVIEGVLAEAATRYGLDPATQLDEALLRIAADWTEQNNINQEPEPAATKSKGKAKVKTTGKAAA